jgi:hypothetical protein
MLCIGQNAFHFIAGVLLIEGFCGTSFGQNLSALVWWSQLPLHE